MTTVLMAHPSPDLYGSDRVLLETVSAFVTGGNRVVVALPYPGPLEDALRERGAEVEFVAFPVLRRSFLSPFGLLRLAGTALRRLPAMIGLIRRLRPAVVLVNTVTIPVWVLAARLVRRPVVCHVHEAEQGGSDLVWKVLYFPLLFCTGLITNSRFTLDTLKKSWPRLDGCSLVVYNGVPGPVHPNPPRSSIDGEVRLLFIGRLSPRKGPQVVIEAVAQLVQAGQQTRLQLLGAVFEGYEWFEVELREQIERSGLSLVVEFLGFNPDIWGHLAEADIVIVPSTLDESFGNTAVEAMLAERPLVVSAISGLIEASEGYANARRVPPGDATALAGAVQDLLAHWPTVVASSPSDRELALERHGEQVYQEGIVSAVGAVTARDGRD